MGRTCDKPEWVKCFPELCEGCEYKKKAETISDLENDFNPGKCSKYFEMLLSHIKEEKPNDRSEKDRKFAILITELEKCEAYYSYYIKERHDK